MDGSTEPNISDFHFKVFQYWDGADPYSLPSPKAWRAAVGNQYNVAGDEDIIDILRDLDTEFVEIYRRIRIAACRSDIARLLLIERYGGLYVDMHCDVGESDVLLGMQEEMSNKEVIFFRAPVSIGHFLTNTAVMARQDSQTISNIRKAVLENVKEHYQKELSEKAYVPYNIYVLSGPWAYATEIMKSPNEFGIKDDLLDRVGIQQLYDDISLNPVLTYQFYSYRKPGQHWSERQKSEMLFDLD